MPGLMRRTMSYLGLVEDYDDEYEYDDDHEPRQRDRPERDRLSIPRDEVRSRLAPVDNEAPPQMVQPHRADLSRITTVHPRTYNDARTIGEQYRSGTPVIMNLSEMDDADAKRLVDFSAGLIFGRRGSIDRVTSKVFLLSPPDVEVTAEDKARIVEGGFYNQS